MVKRRTRRRFWNFKFLDRLPERREARRFLRIGLEARIEGKEASLTISDGNSTHTVNHTLKNDHPSGHVGLYSRQSGADVIQQYDHFLVKSLDGEVLHEESFDHSQEIPENWQGAEYNLMPLYMRDHMKGGKAPMITKERFAPAVKVSH